MRAELWTCLALSACSGALPGPGGFLDADRDEDGWSVSDGDCDDDDEEVNPHALDIPGDDVDQDCVGGDAEALPLWGVEVGDLVISEVMMNPVGVGADFGEWFEVYNDSDYDIDLDGLLVRDFGQDDFLVGAPLVIEEEDFVVFGVWGDPEANGGVEVDHEYEADFGLSNTEDALVLQYDGVVLDQVAWDARYPLASGYAMSLDEEAEADENDEPGAWCLADADDVYGIGGRGTPGDENPECDDPFEGLTLDDVQAGELVITEVMQNPAAVTGDFGEWFEVLNLTGDDLDLRGLRVSDGVADDFEVLSPLVVAADSFAVFGSFLDDEVNGDTPVDWEWRWDFGLGNGGQAIELWYGTLLIDQIEYDNGLTFPDPLGAAMSLDPASATADANDLGVLWCFAVTPFGDGDLGTPGGANPPCTDARQGPELVPGDLIITEIMKNPLQVDGDFGEWFEVYNATAEVVDLAGLTLADDNNDDHTILSSVRIDPGEFAVLGRSDDMKINGGVVVDYVYGNEHRLGNDDDEVIVQFAGTEIDAVRYEILTFPSPLGASMSLDALSFDATANDFGPSWCAGLPPYGAGDRGTPGSANPPC